MSEELNKKIDRVLIDMRPPFANKETSWEQLMHRIEAKETLKSGKHHSMSYVAAAASIVLAIGLLFFMNSGSDRIDTELAEHKTIELPDGSVVNLNSSSYIEFDEEDFSTERELILDGEAFFQVKKGSSFDVITDQGTITVLGTSFNICDRGDFLEVSCKTGKVSVSHEGQKVILTPGLATHNRDGALAPAFSANEASDWIRGSFNFEAESLDFVFDELERQFGVEVDRHNVDDRFFTGEFDSTDLETALIVICQPMGLEYQIKDNSEIVITLK